MATNDNARSDERSPAFGERELAHFEQRLLDERNAQSRRWNSDRKR